MIHKARPEGVTSEISVAIERWWWWWWGVENWDPYEKNEKGAKWKLRGSITSQPED